MRELSKGMIVQLHLALVMAIDAKLLVLDEPTLGLDILYRKSFYETPARGLLRREQDDHRHDAPGRRGRAHPDRPVFINNGKIALHATMDEVGERYAEVMVNPDKADAARALKPLNERQIFGKSIFLFDGIERSRLATLGELHKPSVADLFVATMKGTYA